MKYFETFYLDKEKDMIVDLYLEGERMMYTLRTPNHGTGNLITNLAKLCDLPVSYDENGLKVIRGDVPCYIDAYNRKMYIFRLGNTKTANIYPDGTIEMKAAVPAISKTLMSQTKDYRLGIEKTIIKSYILNDYKFRTDLHTHMNANLTPDLLIALGISHQIRYPLYYVRKLKLRCTPSQILMLETQRAEVARSMKDSPLKGKYLDRRINDNTFINFADLILGNIEDSAYNIARIRNSLAVMKDGQAVFTNLEKVYLYRYVFTKGIRADYDFDITDYGRIPDRDIVRALAQMEKDREHPVYRNNTLFQDKLLWIARSYRSHGIKYVEISDTSLVKPDAAPEVLSRIHRVMPSVTEDTGVTLRFLASLRRIPLTIVRDSVAPSDYSAWLKTIRAVASDPYVAGSDIVGEEINDIRQLAPVISELTAIADSEPSFVIRIHAGENDSLRDNVANSILLVKESLRPGQRMPHVRIGHGLYTASLRSEKGKKLVELLKQTHTVLEFQISSNVRLNNLNNLKDHPLRQYLKAGIYCVQGTDGGALYGTDSMDEQLSLEKLLSLSPEEIMKIRDTEERIMADSMEAFRDKTERFDRECGSGDVRGFYERKISRISGEGSVSTQSAPMRDARNALAPLVREVPRDKAPIVIAGGSFNSDNHRTRMGAEGKKLIDDLLNLCDPAEVCFIVGHGFKAYEKYLMDRNTRGFEIYAFVPAALTEKQAAFYSKQPVFMRPAIETAGMGIYKSVAYEIFKQRESVLIALDGNSPAANMIQEANNAKYRCSIYVDRRARDLKVKASSLQGYLTEFDHADEVLDDILNDAVTSAKRNREYVHDSGL
ncbi:MAG: adenosine deaminase [Oscillospiraceae bacterium]|nr:adenosine deaminase [Oscillospiraceae bacterium]